MRIMSYQDDDNTGVQSKTREEHTGEGSMWVMMWLVCPSLLVLVTRGGL